VCCWWSGQRPQSRGHPSLKDISGYGKPLLSYHIQGAEDSKGLVELGLVEVEKGTRGKSITKITTLGRLPTVGK
jgi:hypothetical protein